MIASAAACEAASASSTDFAPDNAARFLVQLQNLLLGTQGSLQTEHQHMASGLSLQEQRTRSPPSLLLRNQQLLGTQGCVCRSTLTCWYFRPTEVWVITYSLYVLFGRCPLDECFRFSSVLGDPAGTAIAHAHSQFAPTGLPAFGD